MEFTFPDLLSNVGFVVKNLLNLLSECCVFDDYNLVFHWAEGYVLIIIPQSYTITHKNSIHPL